MHANDAIGTGQNVTL